MLAELATGFPLFPGESDIDQVCHRLPAVGASQPTLTHLAPLVSQLFHIMRTFGALTPRMMKVLRDNPLFVGIQVLHASALLSPNVVPHLFPLPCPLEPLQIPEYTELETLESKFRECSQDGATVALDANGIDLIKVTIPPPSLRLPAIAHLFFPPPQRCLAYEPLERPSCAELLNHPYFKGFAERFEPELQEALESDAATFVLGKRRKVRDNSNRSEQPDDTHSPWCVG